MGWKCVGVESLGIRYCCKMGGTSMYKKRLVSRINPSLLLKIILYNTLTLQLTKIN